MGAARVAVVRDAADPARARRRPRHAARRSTGPPAASPPPACSTRSAGEDLHAGTTRGVSNELVHDPATVTLSDGVLVAIQPGQLGTHHQETPR